MSAGARGSRMTGWKSRWLTDELTALSRSGQWDAAIATFASHANLVDSNVYHYTTIINGCGRAGKWDASFRAFSHMVTETDVRPNVYTYTALLNACAQTEQQSNLALRTYAHMRQSATDVVPNVHTMTALIAACAKQGRWEKCLRVLSSCDELLIAPNVRTYTAAIDGCRRAGRWDVAFHLIATKMRNHVDVRPNHVTYNSALNACLGNKDAWVQGLHLFAAMRSDGFVPVGYTKETLMALLAETSYAASSVGGVEEMVVEQPAWQEGRGRGGGSLGDERAAAPEGTRTFGSPP